MLIGGNFSPYRIPAGGVPFYCPIYEHATGDEKVNKYVNNYTISGVTPAERFYDWSFSPGCETDMCDGGADCFSWIGTGANQFTLVAGQGAATAPDQTTAFAASGTEKFAVCHKRGHKVAKIKAYWNGSFGFLDFDGNSSPLFTCFEHACASGAPLAGWQSEQLTPASTKYLTKTVTITFSNHIRSCTVHVNHDGSLGAFTWSSDVTDTINLTGTLTIDPHSGEKTFTLSTWTATEYDAIANATTDISGSAIAGAVWAVGGMWPQCVTDIDTSSLNLPFTMPDPTTLPGYGVGGWTFDYTQTFPSSPAVLPGYTDEQYGKVTRTNTDYKMEVKATVRDGDAVPDSDAPVEFQDYDFKVEIALTDTSVPGAGTSGGNFDFIADMVALAAYWPLNDDVLYPWRTDNLVQVAPLVSRSQVNSSLADGDWPTVNSTSAWKDPNVWLGATPIKMYDGTIQGIPNPAGYQGWYNLSFIDWQACCGSYVNFYTNGWNPSLQGYITLTGAQLPLNCTQWTDNQMVLDHPSGAFICNGQALNYLYGEPVGGGCTIVGNPSDNAYWLTKTAECGEPYESENFARPGGADKFLIDETQVYCAANLAGTGLGSTWTITDSYGNTPSSPPDFTIGYWGGIVFGGFYNVASYVAGVLTLGTKAFNLPSDWHSRSGDDASAFGMLRFSAAPALLGRIPITAIADYASNPPFSGGWTPTYQFASPQTAFGMTPITTSEKIDIFPVSMMALATNVTATRVSDSVFTIPTGYATALYAMIHGAPAYQYCDNYPKGDLVVLQWTLDYRTNSEASRLVGATECDGTTPVTAPATNFGYSSFSQTALAIPYVECNPRVICFSPNGEVFKNGQTIDHTSGFVPDERCGAMQQAEAIWSMTDPLWQPPHLPCDSDISTLWKMDDGSCAASGVYEHAPQVECRITVPAGFPALPSGISIGWASPVLFNTGDVAYAPGAVGYFISGLPAPAVTPWQLAINLKASIATGCRFPYSTWFVG